MPVSGNEEACYRKVSIISTYRFEHCIKLISMVSGQDEWRARLHHWRCICSSPDELMQMNYALCHAARGLTVVSTLR